jgi:hypothetical protein
MGLFIIEFSFVENEICEVFNDIMVCIFHEGFYAIFWDFRFG